MLFGLLCEFESSVLPYDFLKIRQQPVTLKINKMMVKTNTKYKLSSRLENKFLVTAPVSYPIARRIKRMRELKNLLIFSILKKFALE